MTKTMFTEFLREVLNMARRYVSKTPQNKTEEHIFASITEISIGLRKRFPKLRFA